MDAPNIFLGSVPASIHGFVYSDVHPQTHTPKWLCTKKILEEKLLSPPPPPPYPQTNLYIVIEVEVRIKLGKKKLISKYIMYAVKGKGNWYLYWQVFVW